MLGGMLFGGGSLRGRRTWLTLLPLIPPAILAVLYTGRTTIVAPILSWIAAYFAVRIYVHRSYRGVLGPKHFFAAFALLALLLGIGVGLQHLRKLRRPNSSAAEMVDTYAHDASWEGMISEWDRFRYFAFGQVYSFSWYFEQAWRVPPEPKMGTMIFAGPIDLLGYGDRTASWVDSFEAERGIYTNVFTMLRPPMDDFGLIGSLFWWLAIGTIQGWAHVLARRGVVPVITLMIWFYLDISLIGGLFFRYNSVIIAYLLIAWYLTRATVHQRSPVLARGLGARRALQATP